MSLLITDIDAKTKATLLTGGVLLSGSHELYWDSSNLKTGVYFVKLIIDGNVNVQKLVINR